MPGQLEFPTSSGWPPSFWASSIASRYTFGTCAAAIHPKTSASASYLLPGSSRSSHRQTLSLVVFRDVILKVDHDQCTAFHIAVLHKFVFRCTAAVTSGNQNLPSLVTHGRSLNARSSSQSRPSRKSYPSSASISAGWPYSLSQISTSCK